MTEMAAGMTRDARKSPKSGANPPVEGFDTAGRCQRGRPSDRADLHGLLQPDQQVLTLVFHVNIARWVDRPAGIVRNFPSMAIGIGEIT